MISYLYNSGDKLNADDLIITINILDFDKTPKSTQIDYSFDAYNDQNKPIKVYGNALVNWCHDDSGIDFCFRKIYYSVRNFNEPIPKIIIRIDDSNSKMVTKLGSLITYLNKNMVKTNFDVTF